jgi:PAS domain S-box-containing protein
MKSVKKFSRSIALFLVLFMGVSLVSIAAITYFMHSYREKKDARNRLEEIKQELAKVLMENMVILKNSAGELASLPLLAEHCRSGDFDALQLLIRDNIPQVQGAHIIICDNSTERLFSDLPFDTMAGIEDYLVESEAGENHIVRRVGQNTVAIFSTVLTDTLGQFGKCYIIYYLNQDFVFRSIVKSSGVTDPVVLFYNQDGNIYNIETGKGVASSPTPHTTVDMGEPPSVSQELFPKAMVIPIDHFGGLYFLGSLQPVLLGNRAFLIDLIYLCLGFFALICIASILLSKMVTKPLGILAAEAFETAQTPEGRFLREERTGYTEFRQIASAFNQVLANLQTLQRQFKRKAKKELDASEERYRLTLEAAPDAITINSLKDSRFIQVNEAFVKITGYSREEAVGKTLEELNLLPDIAGPHRQIETVRQMGGANGVEIQCRQKNGKIIDAVVSARKVDFEGEECLISVISDRTAQKRLETALQRASKMEAIGTMAGGVAHDLNNILSGIVSYPELMLLDLPKDSPLRRPVLAIQKSGEKAAAIVQDMLTLARRGVPAREVVNLNDIAMEYLKSPEHGNLLSQFPNVRVQTDLEAEVLNIIGSNVHIAKSLMNLVSNAIEAMPGWGEVRIATRNQYIDVPASGYEAVKEGDYVVLEVSDNGIGIAPEDQERIFEPFYTKKKMGKSGTGLGMAVVWGTVKDHNGYIDLQSSQGGGGTVFRLYFPATRNAPAEDKPKIQFENYVGSGESILVVDDVAEQRDIASIILKRLGYEVASVASGEEAVAYLQKHSVDLMVLDMVMEPGMDGLETYRKVLEINPRQKAIIASGFSETERVREAQRLGVGAYVKKPYIMQNIGLAVHHELLNRSRHPEAN